MSLGGDVGKVVEKLDAAKVTALGLPPSTTGSIDALEALSNLTSFSAQGAKGLTGDHVVMAFAREHVCACVCIDNEASPCVYLCAEVRLGG